MTYIHLHLNPMLSHMKRTYTILVLLAGLWLHLGAQGLVFQDKRNNRFRFTSAQTDSIVLTDKATYERMLTTPAEAVDLGLSVRWASYNVGATAPEERGGYFSWGETKEKISYDWGAYRLMELQDDYDIRHFDIGRDITGTQYDVARQLWGSEWRMPTSMEFHELIDRCTFEWTTRNGMSGAVVTGPNGNSIFLPSCSSRGTNYINERGPQAAESEDLSSMDYWTSSLCYSTGYTENYYATHCFATSESHEGVRNEVIMPMNRFYGLQIRAVCSPAPAITVDCQPATDITTGSATFTASFACPDTTRVSEAGIRLHDWNDIQIATFVAEHTGNGRFTVTATGLQEGATLYAEPYIVYDGVCYYGAMQEFQTELSPEVFTPIATGTMAHSVRTLLGSGVFYNEYESTLYRSSRDANKFVLKPFLFNEEGISFTLNAAGEITLQDIFNYTGYDHSTYGAIYACEATMIYSDPAIDDQHSYAENGIHHFILGYHNGSAIFGIVEEVWTPTSDISPSGLYTPATATTEVRDGSRTGRMPAVHPATGTPSSAGAAQSLDKAVLTPAAEISAGRMPMLHTRPFVPSAK